MHTFLEFTPGKPLDIKKEEEWKRSTSTNRHTAGGRLSSLWHMFSIALFWPAASKWGSKAWQMHSQTLPFPILGVEHEISSRRRRKTNVWPFYFRSGAEKVVDGGGDSSLYSWAKRNMGVSQQDVINVTSSVGTRGSSTVHSDSSREENRKWIFLSHQRKFSSQSQVDLASFLLEKCGLFFSTTSQTEICRGNNGSINSLHVSHKIKRFWTAEWCGKSLVLSVTGNWTGSHEWDPKTVGINSNPNWECWRQRTSSKKKECKLQQEPTENNTHQECTVWLYINPSFQARLCRPRHLLQQLSHSSSSSTPFWLLPPKRIKYGQPSWPRQVSRHTIVLKKRNTNHSPSFYTLISLSWLLLT